MKGEGGAVPRIGDLLELEVEKLIFRGPGLARWKGMAVLVPYTAPGDRVRVRVRQVQRDYLRAEVEEIPVPSSQRVCPSCRHFPRCGGCQWQHLSLDAQREWKERILSELLTPLRRLQDFPIHSTLPVSLPEAYRTRAQVKVSREGNRSRLGFFRAASRDLEEIEGCAMLHPDLQDLYRCLRSLRVPTLAQIYPRLEEVWMQRGSWGGEVMLTLLTPPGDRSALRLLGARLREACPKLTGVSLASNGGRATYDSIGRPWVEMTSQGLRLKVGSTCFFQVGTWGAEAIGRTIEAWMELSHRERVLDLYCGVGALGLPLATRARAIVGVESLRAAASLARENAQRNGLANVEIIPSTAEEALLGGRMEGSYDWVIVDPPRSGLTRGVRAGLLRLAPPRIIYVSCDPSTLARDLGHFLQSGYRCRRIQPLDLFPQTYHMETLALLEQDRGGPYAPARKGGGHAPRSKGE